MRCRKSIGSYRRSLVSAEVLVIFHERDLKQEDGIPSRKTRASERGERGEENDERLTELDKAMASD
jgi:hypothetical protein